MKTKHTPFVLVMISAMAVLASCESVNGTCTCNEGPDPIVEDYINMSVEEAERQKDLCEARVCIWEEETNR